MNLRWKTCFSIMGAIMHKLFAVAIACFGSAQQGSAGFQGIGVTAASLLSPEGECSCSDDATFHEDACRTQRNHAPQARPAQ